MRLAVLDDGHAEPEAEMLAMIRERTGNEPLGVVKTLLYRPELFGEPFSEALEVAMRGPSEWSPASASSSPASRRCCGSARSERVPTARSRRTRSVRRSGTRSSPTGGPHRCGPSCTRRWPSSRF